MSANREGEHMEPIGLSKNGIEVMYDPIHSHAATHLEDTPQLLGLVKEAISKLDLHDQRVTTHVDMGRPVGTCDVVATDAHDEIVYGMRKNREDEGLVPFTKSRQGEPCRTVAILLDQIMDGSYELDSAWVGVYGDDDEPFPQASDATERSVGFWINHAFVHGSQEIIDGTETTERPW